MDYRYPLSTTTEADETLRNNISEALNDLQSSATNPSRSESSDSQCVCVQSSFGVQNINVAVEGIGDLEFPLKADTVEKLVSSSTKAKFGKGNETLTDLKVRDTQVIPASNLKVKINEDSFSTIVREINTGLCIDSRCTVVPQLYNMLIYGPQQFFAAHTDTEKIDNMIATLVIVLPSPHKGGDLRIEHGNHLFTFSGELNKVKWVAFYSDQYHWINKVTEGFRVVLTYNIQLKLPPKVSPILSTTKIDGKLNQRVAEYFNGSGRPKKLIYLLNHKYSENSLKWHLLKGKDRILGHGLYLVAKKQNLIPCLALVVDEEFVANCDTKREECISTEKIRYLVGEGNEILLESASFPLEFGHDREICYTIKSWRLWNDFDYTGSGFNGNEATEKQSRYHRACVILCGASLIAIATTNRKKKLLTTEITDAVSKLSEIGSISSELSEAKNKLQHRACQKVFVEGTFPSSEIVISAQDIGNLSFPLDVKVENKLKNLLRMSKEDFILPDQLCVKIEDQTWSNIISNVSSVLNINSRCKLVPRLLGIRMCNDFYKILGVKEDPMLEYNKHMGCYRLGKHKYCRGYLKNRLGDILLVIFLTDTYQREFTVKYANNSFTLSDWNKLENVKYIACYTDCDILVKMQRSGTPVYLMYSFELQSELDVQHEIDTSIVDEPLCNAIRKYFSDEIQPMKIIYLLNHDYSEKKLRWHMLMGSDEEEAYALYAVAKNLNLVPYLGYTEIREHWTEAFSSTVTETHVKVIFLVDENNVELKSVSELDPRVDEGDVCYTLNNVEQSKPFKRDELSLSESICYYNRACVILCVK